MFYSFQIVFLDICQDLILMKVREKFLVSGLNSPDEITRDHINKRVGINKTMKFSGLFTELEVGSLLN
ncbi:MAG: hypothetical protein ACI848_000335 [Roseivirga sp.]